MGKKRSEEDRRQSFSEQYQKILQLFKDRKNEIGGSAGGIVDFAEMGPHQGGSWPFTAKFIKNHFGVPPKYAEDRDNSEYIELLEAESQALIETMMEHYLRHVMPTQHLALNQMFSPDGSGDADWEYLQKKVKDGEASAKQLAKIHKLIDAGAFEPTSDNLRKLHQLKERNKFYYQNLLLKLQVEAGLTQLTWLLIDHEILAELPRRRTLGEEQTMEERNREIYKQFKALTGPPPDGKGMKVKDAHHQIWVDHGISGIRVKQIVESQREQEGLPQRERGRPRKKRK